LLLHKLSLMNEFRKYFDSDRISTIQTTGTDWGLTVYHVGHNEHPGHKPYPDTSHPENYTFSWEKGRILSEYQLVYIPKGKGIFESEASGPIAIKPGSTFLLFPGIWHRFKPENATGWEEYWVGFNGNFAEHLMNQECFSATDPVIEIGHHPEFIQIFIRLLATIKLEGSAFAQLASCLTIQLLGFVYASASSASNSRNRQHLIINKIIFQLRERWSEDVDMKSIAINNNVSYAWLRKAFKEIVGYPPGQYLLNIKLEKSCQLLKETNQSISEISYSCGFASEQHFSRTFKKRIGLNPFQYRNVGIKR
jgi:AraC-like DNA-binding protein